MKVFVTGGSGYIGRSLLRILSERGDSVTALVRSDESAKTVSDLGATPVKGELTDATVLREAAAAADGVVHLALTGDERSGEVDRAAANALLAGAGGNPYVHTGGSWTYGDTDGFADEDAPFAPPMITAWRGPLEEQLLATRTQGSHPVIVRPGIVYGQGGGLLGFFLGEGVQAGAIGYLGDGTSHWSLVHVDDIADLYARALTAPAGGHYLGVTGVSVQTREVAEALGQAAGIPGRTRSISREELAGKLGPLADALFLDQRFATTKAQDELGWNPRHRDPLADLAGGR
ncbi:MULTISPECIES: NAD-dependent epimerase/dehydratase family protein [Streptomyces]|uniref:NAD-dependent epimerase/dehydratase family protein n=1 Tax=Streptomyces eurythermus TaxID=42237 RepID=A0ABW6Z5F8_9ACTN|nr:MULTISPECIES: NAD-dependent epimerase/dehydratase family protein [Streptomyces]QIS74055.1 NAD-dependent epimerase/dehydratase family protein [Streptomyces sp. DSM 40868]WDM16587.1 NAD-dependent epimerase/dehydratase family protein [Streptomyces lavenduligriseus]